MNTNLLDNASVRERLNRKILCEVETDEKRVALTFDDGPSIRNTPALLDMLSKKGILATFFVVGKRVRQNPDLFRRMVEEGHEIGNHTFSHLLLPVLTPRMIRRELQRANDEIRAVGAMSQAPRLLRPPMGWYNDVVLRIAQDQGMRPVLGSIYPRDTNRPGAGVIVGRVLSRIAPGGIIILHDGGWRRQTDRTQTLDAVDKITDTVLSVGYSVGTVGALLDASV